MIYEKIKSSNRPIQHLQALERAQLTQFNEFNV